LLLTSTAKELNTSSASSASCEACVSKFPVKKMSGENSSKLDSTESFIESLHTARKKRSLVLNPDYLDDEKLPEEEKTAVLKEIFNRNIREKQLSRIISHLTPLLDGFHPSSALIYGPTGSGKTVTLIHVLSTFQRVANRSGIKFRYSYIDLTSPKTYFGALNEVAIALNSSNRKYRKGGSLWNTCRP
jgi:cell division control protein 6